MNLLSIVSLLLFSLIVSCSHFSSKQNSYKVGKTKFQIIPNKKLFYISSSKSVKRIIASDNVENLPKLTNDQMDSMSESDYFEYEMKREKQKSIAMLLDLKQAASIKDIKKEKGYSNIFNVFATDKNVSDNCNQIHNEEYKTYKIINSKSCLYNAFYQHDTMNDLVKEGKLPKDFPKKVYSDLIASDDFESLVREIPLSIPHDDGEFKYDDGLVDFIQANLGLNPEVFEKFYNRLVEVKNELNKDQENINSVHLCNMNSDKVRSETGSYIYLVEAQYSAKEIKEMLNTSMKNLNHIATATNKVNCANGNTLAEELKSLTGFLKEIFDSNFNAKDPNIKMKESNNTSEAQGDFANEFIVEVFNSTGYLSTSKGCKSTEEIKRIVQKIMLTSSGRPLQKAIGRVRDRGLIQDDAKFVFMHDGCEGELLLYVNSQTNSDLYEITKFEALKSTRNNTSGKK